MASDEMLEKVVQIADILKGTTLRDTLNILSTQFVFTLLQICTYAHNSDLAEMEMRNYFTFIDETFHEMLTENEEILKR